MLAGGGLVGAIPASLGTLVVDVDRGGAAGVAEAVKVLGQTDCTNQEPE